VQNFVLSPFISLKAHHCFLIPHPQLLSSSRVRKPAPGLLLEVQNSADQMAGMVDPLFGLIRLVDKFVRLKQQVRGVPEEVISVLDAVSHARSGLQALSSVLDGHRENFGDEHGILERIATDVNAFHSTLLRLESFIDSHAPSTDPNANLLGVAGRTIVWIAKEYHSDTVKRMRKDIAMHIKRIEESKTTLLLVAASAIARSNSVVGRTILRRHTETGVPADGGVQLRDPFDDSGRGSGPQNIKASTGESLFSSGDSTWSSVTYVESIPETVGPAPTIASKKSSRPAFVPTGKADMYDNPSPSDIVRLSCPN